MTPERPDVDLLKRYLIGLISPEEQAEIEGRLQDPVYRDYLEAVEDELIDDYLEGRLTGDSGDGFEKHYLHTPERRHKLELARSLVRSLEGTKPALWRSSWLIGLVALLLGAGTSIVFLPRRSQEVISYSPSPAVYRGESKQEPLRISPETVLVRFHLDYGNRVAPDLATLRSVDSDGELWRQRLVPPHSEPIQIALPASLLPPGDYVLTLHAGGSVAGSYSFRAERK